MRERFSGGSGFLILDEIHKYSRWRQVVKGFFDKRKDNLQILVTGSARLDYYRRGGDSLQGRYHFYRLLPLSCAELSDSTISTLQDLLMYGGFPGPFSLQSEKESRRWSREYRPLHGPLVSEGFGLAHTCLYAKTLSLCPDRD